MPVIDGVFVPRSPLTPAELHVDFLLHNTHVLSRRHAVEKAALPKARRVVQVAQLIGDIGSAHDELAATLARALEQTARFGWREARNELARLRAAEPLTAAANPPAPQRLSDIVRDGFDGVKAYIRGAAVALTGDVITAVMTALRTHGDPTIAQAVAREQAGRVLHRGVLDLVGTTLNLGRTASVRALPDPPAFALRSEQLDENTCGPCETLHGTIVRFGTPDYFAVLPPTGCLGGGRCRALMVFADGPRQVHTPELLAA